MEEKYACSKLIELEHIARKYEKIMEKMASTILEQNKVLKSLNKKIVLAYKELPKKKRKKIERKVAEYDSTRTASKAG